MMLKKQIFFIVAAWCLMSGNALAQPPMLAYDVSPPDYQCTPGTLRNCYLPASNVWGPVNPAVGGPTVTQAFVQFTLTQPQTIKATYHALFFLFSTGMYMPGVGIDGFDVAHLCSQFEPSITQDNPGLTLSASSEATCLVQLPAGTHTVYAMEFARPSTGGATSAFRGVNNQALIVEFY